MPPSWGNSAKARRRAARTVSPDMRKLRLEDDEDEVCEAEVPSSGKSSRRREPNDVRDLQRQVDSQKSQIWRLEGELRAANTEIRRLGRMVEGSQAAAATELEYRLHLVR